MERTCIQLRDNVQDHCDLIREDLGKSNVASCNLCDEDSCNSGMKHSGDWVVGTIIVSILTMIIKL